MNVDEILLLQSVPLMQFLFPKAWILNGFECILLDILDILDKYCNPPFVTNTATQTYLTIIIHPVPVLSMDKEIFQYLDMDIYFEYLSNRREHYKV